MNSFSVIGARDVFQILILALVIFCAYLLFRRTRSAQILLGLVIAIIVLVLMTFAFHLEVLSWIVRKILVVLIFGAIVLFQAELRQIFAVLGQRRFRLLSAIRGGGSVQTEQIEEILSVVRELSLHRFGAIIAIERDVSLRSFSEHGTVLNAPFNGRLLFSLFYPNTPFHDGGAIIVNDKIYAAACVFPLTQRKLPMDLGTRHRAAVGLSEKCDAVVLVVSEETGGIGLAFQGKLYRKLTPERLHDYLEVLLPKENLSESLKHLLSAIEKEEDAE